MNTFVIEIDTELNQDNLERRLQGNDMILNWLKIWRIKIEVKEKC